MSVMWLVDGDFFQERMALAEYQRMMQLDREETTLQAKATAESKAEALKAPRAATESATLTPEAAKMLAALPVPPPNSEVAAQPQADLEHRMGFGQAQIDPVHAVEQSARLESDGGKESRTATTVAELMSRHPYTVTANDSAEFALETLKAAGCHHLPVVDEEQRLIGLVSDRDLLGREGLLSERMVSRVLTATPTTGLEEAAQAMAQERFHCLVVLDGEQRPLGMLTSFDLMKFLVKHPATKLWQTQAHTSTGA